MELARQTVDVGLFTNQLAAMQRFYGEELGLQFESVLPVGGGYKQHRYLANGSVIKLMHTEEPLPRRHPGGYETIMIASSKVAGSRAFADPDDNTVELIPTGQDDVTQLEIRLGVKNTDAFGEFYTRALGATAIGHDRYRIGETIVGVYHEPEIRPQASAAFANAMDVIKAMAGLGIRYITLGVTSCDDAFSQATAGGAAAAVSPVNFGTVARICFVRDPDGNFVEIAQRPAPAA
ncbi:MAG TPA: VOC family protein [Candidatus Binataceae bacterium]|nr:VOC family protein [Candidatus Binataceae bacterium]